MDAQAKPTTDAERRRIFAESNAKIDASRAQVEEARRRFFEARERLYAPNGHARR